MNNIDIQHVNVFYSSLCMLIILCIRQYMETNLLVQKLKLAKPTRKNKKPFETYEV
jgi:hypothetical protein